MIDERGFTGRTLHHALFKRIVRNRGRELAIRSRFFLGQVRNLDKTHDIQMQTIAWLMESKPDVLIIATGWDGVCEVADGVRRIPGVEVKLLKTAEARQLYNRLKKSGKMVAIHYHSTC